jgi:para-nitrobenzyl esterase
MMKKKSRSETPSGDIADIDRRTILKRAALVVGAGAAIPSCISTENEPSTSPSYGSENSSVIAREGAAVVEIESGRIAGAIIRGIYSFKGIPYGSTTAGQNRFCPAQKPKPWTGTRSSRHYGFVCPQDKGMGRLNDEEAFMFQWQDSVEGEDCLRVNVWTPGINDNNKRPVMVWLHGGGFSAGSGHDTLMLDGENLARRGDVVVVSLNHRLNILGFLDLSKYGEKYAQSGNVGMLDLGLAHK